MISAGYMLLFFPTPCQFFFFSTKLVIPASHKGHIGSFIQGNLPLSCKHPWVRLRGGMVHDKHEYLANLCFLVLSLSWFHPIKFVKNSASIYSSEILIIFNYFALPTLLNILTHELECIYAHAYMCKKWVWRRLFHSFSDSAIEWFIISGLWLCHKASRTCCINQGNDIIIF